MTVEWLCKYRDNSNTSPMKSQFCQLAGLWADMIIGQLNVLKDASRLGRPHFRPMQIPCQAAELFTRFVGVLLQIVLGGDEVRLRRIEIVSRIAGDHAVRHVVQYGKDEGGGGA